MKPFYLFGYESQIKPELRALSYVGSEGHTIYLLMFASIPVVSADEATSYRLCPQQMQSLAISAQVSRRRELSCLV